MSHQLVADVEDGGDRIIYRDAVYACVPGFRPLLLDLVVPRAPAPVAVVLYLHGGGFASGTHKTTRDLLGREVTEVLTARGIAVASAAYRLSGEACFPAAIHDVKAAVRWLRRHAHELNIDPTRVGAWGGSAGGYLTAMLAVTAGSPDFDGEVGLIGEDSGIRAGVSWYGPANLATQPRLGPPGLGNTDPTCSPEARLLGAAPETVPELAARASPVTHVGADSAPLLLVHGTEDDGVPISQSEELLAAYQRAGVAVTLTRVTGADHGFTTIDREGLLQASAEFLARHLNAG